MRIFVTRADGTTDPDALWRELLKRPGTTATADAVKAFNAHVRFDRELPAGTVLLIPEAADLKAGAGTAVGVGDINQVIADVDTGLKATSSRARTGFEMRESDHAALAAALKGAASRRLIESDPELKKQLQSVEAGFKADKQRAHETQSQLAELERLAAEEFEKLRKLLGG